MAQRDANGRLLPGHGALNPGGQVQAFAKVRRMLEEHVPGAAQKMVELMAHEDPKVALAAAKDILDRTLGKAKESKDVKFEGNGVIAELLAEIAAARKARKDDDDEDSEP